MTANTSLLKTFLIRLWALGCSLKLAIALASAATLLIMGGSLVMHDNPDIFASMDQEVMGTWLQNAWTRSPQLTFWVPLSGLCILLFAVNTACCLIDWLTKITTRWRKSGEYLIHAGFILLTIAYIWGGTSGFRSGPHRLEPGQRLSIPSMPGYALQLDEFTTKLGQGGQPLDMINKVSLWKNGKNVARQTVRINHPLLYDGLVILPTSFGREPTGFRFHRPGADPVDLIPGRRLAIAPGLTLVTHQFFPDARQNNGGRVMQLGGRLNNPALQLSLLDPSGETWRGWYFLRQPLPAALTRAGISLRPLEPVYTPFSLLTINRDPGDKLALVGASCLTVGVILAFFSFYRKRAVGDRPEV